MLLPGHDQLVVDRLLRRGERAEGGHLSETIDVDDYLRRLRLRIGLKLGQTGLLGLPGLLGGVLGQVLGHAAPSAGGGDFGG